MFQEVEIHHKVDFMIFLQKFTRLWEMRKTVRSDFFINFRFTFYSEVGHLSNQSAKKGKNTGFWPEFWKKNP